VRRNPTHDAAGFPILPITGQSLTRMRDEFSRFLQHVELSIWIHPDAWSSLSDLAVTSLTAPERKAQKAFEVKE
jgi:hypothetical protein